MQSRQRLLVAAALVAVTAAASVLAAPSLPERLVTHWNAAGEPNGTMATPLALVLVPAASAAVLGLFLLIPRIDPLRVNIREFRRYYDWFVVLFAAYMLVVHVGVLAYNLGYRFDFTSLVVAGVGVLFFYTGVVLEHARQNWFLGIRTPWTMSSEAVWDRTHALAGRLFKVAGVLALVGLLFGRYAVYFVVVPAVAVGVVTFVYSYLLYERLADDAGEVST